MRLPLRINARGKLSNNDWWASAIQYAKQQIMQQEDEAIFAALDATVKSSSQDSNGS